MQDGVIIHVERVGRLANQMIQHMVQLFVASHIPGAILSGVDIPEWGIYQPDRRTGRERSFVVQRDTPMKLPMERILAAVEAGQADCIVLRNYMQHTENLLPRDVYDRLYLRRALPKEPARIEDDELLINIRGEEILFGVAPDYLTVPTSYLAGIVAETGLRPVMMGQLTPGPYLDALRRTFPDARFIPTEGALVDFETIRSARHIVPSISTFSWLAAWLSKAERIYLPVAGIFNPYQRPDIMMLPLDDDRYRFDVFPIYFALPFQEAVAHHATIEGLWRRYPRAHLRKRLASKSRFPFDVAAMAEFFDEDYYLRQNPDIAHARNTGAIPSGFEHYTRVGHEEGRAPFHIDRVWYCHSYPVAASEMSTGEFRNLQQHFVEIGHGRGYRRTP